MDVIAEVVAAPAITKNKKFSVQESMEKAVAEKDILRQPFFLEE